MPLAKIGVQISLKGAQALKQARTIGAKINKTLGKIKPIAGLLGGVGGAFIVQDMTRKIVAFDMALTRMSIQAGKSKKEQADLRKEMMNISKDTAKSTDEIAAMGQSVIDATGDFDFMKTVLRDVAVMSQVTGADMGGLGNIVSDLKNNFNLTGKEATQMLREMTEAGEKGKFTLPEFATSGARALSAMKLAGVETTAEIRHANAELQIMRRGFSSAEETSVAYLGTIGRLAAQAEELRGKGVEVFQADDPTKMRQISDILTEIFEKMGTSPEILEELFGIRNVVGVRTIATAFEKAKEEGKDLNDVLSVFTEVTGDSARFQKDMNRVLGTTGGQLEIFKANLLSIFDEEFMGNINELAGYLPQFTALLKFIVDNKAAILAFWALQKVGGIAPAAADAAGVGTAGVGAAGAGAAIGGAGRKAKAALPKRVTKVAPGNIRAPKLGFMQNLIQSIGVGFAASEVSKGQAESTSNLAAEIKKQEEALGRTLTKMEQIKLIFSGVSPSLGAGAQWQAPEERKEGLSDQDLKGIEKAVEKGASRAKPKVFIPSPLKDSGGTEGAPVHGGD